MAKTETVKLNVEQKDGEVRVSFAGDEPHVFEVTKGQIEVPADLAADFVAAIPGASPANADAREATTTGTTAAVSPTS